MIPFWLGVGLLLTAALFFFASMTVAKLALVCCGTGGVIMAAMMEAS